VLPASLTPEQREAVEAYRAARAAFDLAADREDAAFRRWFDKVQAGEPTSGAAASRLANEANYRSADLSSAQGRLFRLDLDPWDVDDADEHERTFIA